MHDADFGGGAWLLFYASMWRQNCNHVFVRQHFRLDILREHGVLPHALYRLADCNDLSYCTKHGFDKGFNRNRACEKRNLDSKFDGSVKRKLGKAHLVFEDLPIGFSS